MYLALVAHATPRAQKSRIFGPRLRPLLRSPYTIGMFRAFLWSVSAAILCLGSGFSPVRADTVALVGKPPFESVRITDCRRGKITFRGLSGEYLRKSLRQVDWLACDQLESLTDAENSARQGNYEAAIAAYLRAIDETGGGWMRELCRARLVRAYDRSGQFDRAVACFIDMLRDEPLTPIELAPRSPGPSGEAGNRDSIDALIAARKRDGAIRESAAAGELVISLCLLEDLPLPAEFAAGGRYGRVTAGGGNIAGATSEDEDEENAPLLFGAPIVRTARGSTRVQLSGDSFLLERAEQLVARGEASRALRMLELGVTFVPESEVGPWRLGIGVARAAGGDPARAAEELIGLAESSAPQAIRDEALYHAGIAHERLGRADVASRLYRELSNRSGLSQALQIRVREATRRLSAE